MHFICRSFSANSESKSWSRYWENESDDPSIKLTKGHLFALININSDEDKDLNSIGHDISYEFNQNYFNSETSNNILVDLQQSINSIIKNPLYADYKIDILVAAVLNNQLYLAIFGDCQVIFKRDQQISLLLNSSDNQIETISGPLQSQDRIFLLTNSFFEKITWVKIKQFLSDSKIQNVEENFLSAIYSLDNQKDLAAAFIELESDVSTSLITEDNNQTTNFEPIIAVPKKKLNIFHLLQKIKKSNSVFVSHHQTKEVNKRKKISLLLGIILTIGLFVSIYFGYQKNKIKQVESQYQTLKTQIDSQITQINQIKTLNLDTARESASTAQKTLNKMIALKTHSDEIEKYSSQLQSILSQTGSSDNFTPDFFYDTSQIISQPQFQKIVFNDNKIYLLDPQNGRLDYLDITNKSSKSILTSDKIKSAINLALDKTNLYLINKESISLVEKDSLSSKIKFENVQPTDFKFWNGAAYVLDSNNQTIWKFNPNATGFSKAQNWLKNDAKLELGASSLSINGKIWVLYQAGTISPYLSGVVSEFKPSQKSEFTKTNNLDVTQEKELLTFVDNDNIVYLYQKSGELLSKFNLGNLKVNDIAFNEANNLIYILASDQKIYFVKF